MLVLRRALSIAVSLSATGCLCIGETIEQQPPPDSGRPDAGSPDAGQIDAGQIDAGPGSKATWTRICDNSPGTCPIGPDWSALRGFLNVLPYDSSRHELIYLGAGIGDNSIYSNALWGYVPSRGGVPGHMVLRVDSQVKGSQARENCPNYMPLTPSSPPALPEALTGAPLAGHPNGNAVFDTARNKLYMSGWICSGQFEPRTHIYDSATARIEQSLDVYEYSPLCNWSDTYPHECDPGRNFQSWVYMARAPSGHGIDRALLGLSNGFGSRRMVEFDPATRSYCVIGAGCPGPDVTAEDGQPCAAGTCPPELITSYGIVANDSDGYVYVYGGCNGSSPGNGTTNACNGPKLNDLWRYDGELRRFSKVQPAGGVKPSATNSSDPFFAFDGLRNRFLLFAATGEVWQFRIATNAWSRVTPSNAGPEYTALLADYCSGNIAGYDPLSDTMVLMFGGTGGQAYSPNIWELHFED